MATTVIQGEALSENGRISGGELNKPPVVKRPARNISSSKASGPFATSSHIGGELSQGGTIASITELPKGKIVAGGSSQRRRRK